MEESEKKMVLSLTKEEIFEFVENYLIKFQDSRFDQKTDDYVIRTLGKFLGSHGLNPIQPHRIEFFSRNPESPWEEQRFVVDWRPEVILGVDAFQYDSVYIAIVLKEKEDIYPFGHIFKGTEGITRTKNNMLHRNSL